MELCRDGLWWGSLKKVCLSVYSGATQRGSPAVHWAGWLLSSLLTAVGVPMHRGVHPRALTPKVRCLAVPLGSRVCSPGCPLAPREVGDGAALAWLGGGGSEECSRFKNRFGVLILGRQVGEKPRLRVVRGKCWRCSQRLGSQGRSDGGSLWRGKGRCGGVPTACVCPAGTSLPGELMPRRPPPPPGLGYCPSSARVPTYRCARGGAGG